MKVLLIFFAFTLTIAANAQNTEQDRLDFIESFIQVVIQHDQKQILKHVEKSYRKEQLRFLKGNKVQFINELFSGYNESKEFVTPDLNEIRNIELIDMKETSGENYNCAFELETDDSILLVEIILVYRRGKLGFVGAVG